MIKALLFDLGSTVLAEESYDLAAGFSVIADQLVPQITFEVLCDAVESSQNRSFEFSVLDWIQEHALGSQKLERAREIEFRLWESTVSLKPTHEVLEALDYLRHSKVRVAAISNAIFSAHCISAELQKHDLLKYFEFIISSADFGFRKPNTEIFTSALKKMNIAAVDAFYVGDNFNTDVVGSYAAGMTPILFGDNNRVEEAGIEYKCLSSWSGLKDLLNQD